MTIIAKWSIFKTSCSWATSSQLLRPKFPNIVRVEYKNKPSCFCTGESAVCNSTTNFWKENIPSFLYKLHAYFRLKYKLKECVL
jgi:hypothetical protein